MFENAAALAIWLGGIIFLDNVIKPLFKEEQESSGRLWKIIGNSKISLTKIKKSNSLYLLNKFIKLSQEVYSPGIPAWRAPLERSHTVYISREIKLI